MTVPSPCINICTLDAASGLCLGYARTLQEISDWSNLDDAGKRAVWARIAERRSQGLVPEQPIALKPRPKTLSAR